MPFSHISRRQVQKVQLTFLLLIIVYLFVSAEAAAATRDYKLVGFYSDLLNDDNFILDISSFLKH